MEEKNNWMAASGAIIGAIVAGIPGAIIGGLIGAVAKEILCPLCGSIMTNVERNLWKCNRCGYTMYRE
jgi:ribosomal protein S27AE